MKQLLRLFLLFFIFPAFAVTSKSYVGSAVVPLQDEIPAKNANTVLINTGAAGEIGTKKIYDETQGFETQTDALVTAETFNAAVQNAIDNEYVCIEWLGEHIPSNCLLYQIRAVTPKTTSLPDGYTRLEYITTNTTAYIDTQKRLGTNFELYATIMLLSNTDNFPIISSSLGKTDFVVVTYGAKVLGSGISNKFESGGITTYGVNAPFSFGISPQWVMHAYGKKKQLNRPYRGSGNLIIGRAPNENSTPIRFYSVQLYNNGVLDGNFIPARRNSDGELGMYDTVSGTFFTNAGEGEFVAGPDAATNIYLPSGD